MGSFQRFESSSSEWQVCIQVVVSLSLLMRTTRRNQYLWLSSKYFNRKEIHKKKLFLSLDIRYLLILRSLPLAMFTNPGTVHLVPSKWFYREKHSRGNINRFIFLLIICSVKIGAGTSLPGLVAAKIGAETVILCDNPAVEKWFPLIRETIASNSMIADRIRIESLDWYDDNSIDQLMTKYCPVNIDLIIASDVFFHKKGIRQTERIREMIFIPDFETIISLLDRLFTACQTLLKFIGTIECRR